VVRCGCRAYRISNIVAAAIAHADRNLKSLGPFGVVFFFVSKFSKIKTSFYLSLKNFKKYILVLNYEVDIGD
jgi:hypothetical protein